MKVNKLFCISVVGVLLLLLTSCANNVQVMKEYKTYSNILYNISYPSDWEEPNVDKKLIKNSRVYFDTNDSKILGLSISIDFFGTNTVAIMEERINNIKKTPNLLCEVKEYTISGKQGYNIKIKEDGKINEVYVVENKGLVYELNFETKGTINKESQIKIDKILDTFTFQNRKSINELWQNWNKYSEGNLEVYYPKHSIISNDVEGWTKGRIKAFDYIIEYLGVESTDEIIKIYVFDSQDQADEYGLTLGFALSEYNEIYTKYSQSEGHEIAHCISWWINNGERLTSDLINEGFATYFDMSGRNYDRISAEILKEKNYNVKLFGNDFRKNEDGEAYTLGASFVKYLIDEYGIDLFKEFFAQNQYNEAESFQKFYKKSGETLINEWVEKEKSIIMK
ncbi:hypothetical protein SH2C18_23090 [Clostridium sediminicola]|uniref:hypothetical protein n=1 Tax=Clostridium sediminicola TaxID=3114879 RepID=UPI0031F23927